MEKYSKVFDKKGAVEQKVMRSHIIKNKSGLPVSHMVVIG